MLEIKPLPKPRPPPSCPQCGQAIACPPVHFTADLVSSTGDIEAERDPDGRNFRFHGATGRVRSRTVRAFCSRTCLELWWLDDQADAQLIAAPAELEVAAMLGAVLQAGPEAGQPGPQVPNAVLHPEVADAAHLHCDCGGQPHGAADRNLHLILSTHEVALPMAIHDVSEHRCPCELGAWWRAPAEGPLSMPIEQLAAELAPALAGLGAIVATEPESEPEA